MNEEKKELLRNIIQLRMETKSELEQYRFLSEHTGCRYDKEINALLDRLLRLDELEIIVTK
jgi:hypothetical protein